MERGNTVKGRGRGANEAEVKGRETEKLKKMARQAAGGR